MITNQIAQSDDHTLTNSLTHMYGLLSYIEEIVQRNAGDQTTYSAQVARYLAESFMAFAQTYFNAFMTALDADVSVLPTQQLYLMHQAIRRLSNEWEELAGILAAISDPRINVLEKIVRVAQPSSYWASDYIAEEQKRATSQRNIRASMQSPPQFVTIPYFRRHFELVSYHYAPEVFVTGVPLYCLESPWDWHVLWHEMAGHVVHLLEEKNEIEERIIPALQVHGYWELWQKYYDLTVPSSGSMLNTTGANTTAANNDEIAFEADAVSDDMKSAPTWDDIKQADWVAEILEDAYGLLSLGPPVYSSLERVLHQTYADDYILADTRHPPLRLRLDMAGAVLLTMLAEDDRRKTLESLGFDGQRISQCQELLPIAQVITTTLIGSENQPGYIRELFDLSEAKLAESLQQWLLNDKALPSDATIPALINAARLAYIERPSAALKISGAVKEAILKVSLSSSDPEPPAEYSRSDFQPLVEGKTWQELLDAPFSKADQVDPARHTHSQGKGVWLDFGPTHGQMHKIWHTTKDHL